MEILVEQVHPELPVRGELADAGDVLVGDHGHVLELEERSAVGRFGQADVEFGRDPRSSPRSRRSDAARGTRGSAPWAFPSRWYSPPTRRSPLTLPSHFASWAGSVIAAQTASMRRIEPAPQAHGVAEADRGEAPSQIPCREFDLGIDEVHWSWS